MPPSYNDMYRAAQDATRDLRDALNRLSSQLNNLTSQVNTTNVQSQNNDIRRSLADVRYNLAQLFKTNATPARASPEQQYILQALHRIEMRMTALEGFAKDVSDYLRAQRELEDEDQARQGNHRRKPRP